MNFSWQFCSSESLNLTETLRFVFFVCFFSFVQHLTLCNIIVHQNLILKSFFLPCEDAELFGTKPESDPFSGLDSKQDPFGTEPPVKPQVNGRDSASPEMFDLSRLAPPLSAPATRVCRTPEAFLGPTGASLVNLDTLIPPNPPTKTHNNPFLSGKTPF